MTEAALDQAPAPGNPTPAAPVVPAAPAAPVAPAAPAAPVAPAAPAVDKPFYNTFEDTKLKTWAEGKGWKGPEAAVKSAFHLERMVGAPAEQILRRPVEGDVDGLRTLRQQLGAPTDASGYTVPGVAESNDDSVKKYGAHMSQAFHQAGLTQDQVDTVMNAGTDFLTAAEEAQKEDYRLATQAEEQTLRREWGAGYDKQTNLASSAATKLGFTTEMINAVEDTVGFAETMKLFADLGAKLGEDNFVDPALPTHGQTFGGNLTPVQAKEAWSQFVADPNNMAALNSKNHPGHAAAMARKTDIFSLMYPEG